MKVNLHHSAFDFTSVTTQGSFSENSLLYTYTVKVESFTLCQIIKNEMSWNDIEHIEILNEIIRC